MDDLEYVAELFQFESVSSCEVLDRCGVVVIDFDPAKVNGYTERANRTPLHTPCKHCRMPIELKKRGRTPEYCCRDCQIKAQHKRRSETRAAAAIAAGRTPGKNTRKAYVKKPDVRGVYLRKPDGSRLPVLPLSRRNP